MHGLHFWALRIILENSLKFKEKKIEIDKHGKGPIKWTNHQLYVQNVNLKSTTSFLNLTQEEFATVLKMT